MRIRWIGICAAALVGLTVQPVFALDEVVYSAAVDNTKVALGENVQYLVTVHYGIDTMVPSVVTPSFDRFAILREYQTNQESPGENDKHLILKKMWLLQPTEAGRLSIAASIVNYQDPVTNLLKTGKTEALFVEVAPPAGEAAATAASARASGRTAVPAYIWLSAAAALAALGVWMLLRPRRKPAAASQRSPEDRAVLELQAALARLEEDDGKADGYYASLTRTLLDYLQAKYGLDANVLSVGALLAELGRMGFNRELLAAMDAFFKTAEKAKFGGYMPNEDEMIVLHGTVTRFIEAGRKVKKGKA